MPRPKAHKDETKAPRFLPAGDCALTVEFGNAVSPEINARVLAFDAAIARAGIDGIVETIPTYRSLQVVYEPERLGHAELLEALARLADTAAAEAAGGRLWEVPVAYGGELGFDLELVAEHHGMTPQEVAELHASATYRVYMIGFQPGFTYLGGLPERLHMPRMASPRTMTPPGCVSIGGIQAAISSVAAPSGWRILGRTPVRTFDLRREEPFLFRPGDRIRFSPIEAADFEAQAARAEAGEVLARRLEET